MSKYGTVSPDELNTPIMQKLRDLCGLTDPSVEQNIILTCILNHNFKRKEVAFYFSFQFRENISQEAIGTCLYHCFRTQMGERHERWEHELFMWSRFGNNGNHCKGASKS